MLRTILSVSGSDSENFLQGLISQDIRLLRPPTQNNLIYTALLSPQGKYLFDFFVLRHEGEYLIDIQMDRGNILMQRLNFYKLRAAVDIAASGWRVIYGIGVPPAAAYRDPRHKALGWRSYSFAPFPHDLLERQIDSANYTSLRVKYGIAESGLELLVNKTYILEMGFECFHGVSFTKGCYVGQEVTARMKHKAVLHKGLARVNLSHSVAYNTPIMQAKRSIGCVYSTAPIKMDKTVEALAYLYFKQIGDSMIADTAQVTLLERIS